MKALLIIDVQNDFCEGGPLAVEGAVNIIPIINELMEVFPLVLATKDWHPEDSEHFQHWPVHCVQGTKGAELNPYLNEKKIDHVFVKGTGLTENGYSAFEANDTDLAEYLKDHDVDELYICGLATEYCVKASALDAVKDGLIVFLVKDAIEGLDAAPGDIDKALHDMKQAGIRMISSRTIISSMEAMA